PIWLSLICRNVIPPAPCAMASSMMPSERGTPPATVHSTPVPTQLTHSSTLGRLGPSSRSCSLMVGLPGSRWLNARGSFLRLLTVRSGLGGVYFRPFYLFSRQGPDRFGHERGRAGARPRCFVTTDRGEDFHCNRRCRRRW